MSEEEISKEDFEKYEKLRKGKVNMLNIEEVKKYTGLTTAKIFHIMENYTEIHKHFKELNKKGGKS